MRRFHEGLASVIYFRNKKAPNQVTGKFVFLLPSMQLIH